MNRHLCILRSAPALLIVSAVLLFASVFALLGSAALAADESATPPRMVDAGRIDATCAPCRDFYAFANGVWIKNTPVPASETWYGAWPMVRDRNDVVLREIFEKGAQAVRSGSAARNTNVGRVGAFYASCMDSAAVDRAGAKPIQPTLDAIAAITSVNGLVRAFAFRAGTPAPVAPFTISPAPDSTNSNRMIVSASQVNLGLGDRDPYLRDDDRSRSLRERYLEHVRRIFELLGESTSQAIGDADRVMAIETELARISVAAAAVREASTKSNKKSIGEFSALTPHIDWKSYLEQVGGSSVKEINVLTPTYFAALDAALVRIPLDDFKTYMRWRVASAASVFLSSPFNAEALRRRALLRGVSEELPRQRLCTDFSLITMGFGIGEEFVRRTFSPARKARANAMVDSLVATMRARIERLDWMSEPTKRGALAKLDAMRRNIGYPDTWVDYSGVELSPNDFFGNMKRLDDFNQRRLWARVGKPVDRSEWTDNLPQTVSANYIVTANRLVLPAGILQPPFFDPDRDDPANYGAIGAIIAHEIAHAFDDRGRRFDEDGNVRNWWVAEDEAKYLGSTQPLIAQFDAYTVLDSATHLNGTQTLIENIADLLGSSVAYEAMERAFRGKEQTKMDGFTPAQRFFLGYAQMWGEVRRPESLREQVRRDTHAPAQWRVNGTLSNLPEFRRAWGCKDEDPMVRSAQTRVSIW